MTAEIEHPLKNYTLVTGAGLWCRVKIRIAPQAREFGDAKMR